MKDIQQTKCPVCGEDVELDETLEVGDITYCGSCGGALKISRLVPAEVEEVEVFSEEYDDGNSEAIH